MKRIGFIWDNVCSLENIKAAIWLSSRKKKEHKYVAPVLKDIEGHAKEIQRLLVTKTYAVVSYWGWIKHSDSRGFYNEYCKPIASVGKAKGVISKHAKIRNLRERQTENSV